MKAVLFAALAILLVLNFFFTIFLYYRISHDGASSRVSSPITLISFIRNDAHLSWFQNSYKEHQNSIPISERPDTIVCMCIEKPVSSLESSSIFIHKTSDCNIVSLFSCGLKHMANSEYFMFLEPGFFLVNDFVPFMSNLHDDQNLIMVLALESASSDGKMHQPSENVHDMLDKWKQKKLRNYLAWRRHDFKISHYVIPLMEENRNQELDKKTLLLNRKVHVPDVFHFMLHRKYREKMVLILERMRLMYLHETSSLMDTRKRLVHELREMTVHVLVEKVILYKETPRTPGTTLSTHLSLDRLESLKIIVDRWAGPIVAVFNVKVKEDCAKIPVLPHTTTSCRVNEYEMTKIQQTSGSYIPPSYPVNSLRNVALDLVETEFVFLTDVDFCPDVKLYEQLTTLEKRTLNDVVWKGPKSNLNLKEFFMSNHVMVIPAFDLKNGNYFPTSKEMLLNLVKSSQMTPVLSQSAWKQHHEAHRAIDYQKWYKSTQMYEITYNFPFEPVRSTHSHINSIFLPVRIICHILMSDSTIMVMTRFIITTYLTKCNSDTLLIHLIS